MTKLWSDDAWEDYLYWQSQDKKTLRKINRLLSSIERDGELEGEGHPERLKENFSGWRGRHIDQKNRLIYRVCGEYLEIISCREHY